MTVLKEPPDRKAGDKLQAAGDAAERQMAFYLRRAFGESEDVHVINGLRLVEGDDAAQIDHLVIHAAGAILIESKSVTQKVRVNARGEWARLWDGHWRGMPSPVLQAQHQADFLRAYLHKRRAQLRDRALIGLVERGFFYFDLDVLAAVSDGGIIERDSPDVAPQALKADQVPGHVQAIIARQRKAAGLGTVIFGKADDMRLSLKAHELQRVLDLLLADHRDLVNREAEAPAAVLPAAPPEPQVPQKVPPPSVTDSAVPGATAVCKECGAGDLTIQYGKFGYYWKCACGGNTKIDKTAADGRQGKKLRKQGREFFLVFDDGEEILFHTNPEAEAATAS